MEKLLPSHATAIRKRLAEVGHLPIATYSVDNLIPRNNNILSVFQEGEMYSGIYQKSKAQATIVVPAAPYIAPYIPTEKFIDASQSTFGHSIKLHERLSARETLSPHLIVWWKDNENSDIYSLRNLPKPERTAIGGVVTQAIIDGIRILHQIEGEYPRIGGSWGKASEEDRRLGLSRGGPTVKEGHMHLFSAGRVPEFTQTGNQLTAGEKATHFHPWNHIFQEEFGQVFSGILQNRVKSYLSDSVGVKAKPTHDVILENGRGSFMKGYSLSFDHPISFGEGFDIIVDTAEQFGNLYKSMRGFYEEYYKLIFAGNSKDSLHNDPSFADLRNQMKQRMESLGIPTDKAQALEDFVLRIRPTYGQLLHWRDELQLKAESTDLLDREIERYSRIRRRLNSSQSIHDVPLKETVETPDRYQSIIHTWPAQFSAAYEFSYTVGANGEPEVTGITISPVIGSLETSERIYEAVLKRPIAA